MYTYTEKFLGAEMINCKVLFLKVFIHESPFKGSASLLFSVVIVVVVIGCDMRSPPQKSQQLIQTVHKLWVYKTMRCVCTLPWQFL